MTKEISLQTEIEVLDERIVELKEEVEKWKEKYDILYSTLEDIVNIAHKQM